MKSPEIPRVKICCIQSVEEAWAAIGHGARALGLVSAMPSGPGPIPEERIAEIAAALPPGISAFLLTSETDPSAIAAQQRRCLCGVIQLCDLPSVKDYAVLRAELPGVVLVQVIHVTDEKSIDEACQRAPHVDGLLLDSGRRDKSVKELGGTGRTHDWSVSRRIVEAVEKSVLLAGGLNPDNVGEAIREVKPHGVDVCSGVRTDGTLDVAKLAAFMDVASADNHNSADA